MKNNDIVTAKRWKAALPHMFICKDGVALIVFLPRDDAWP
jgi:hypothetical protein